MSARRLTLVALDELQPASVNAKLHDAHTIGRSISRFGYIEPIVMDERTQRLVAGHGRREDLIERRDRGESPPDGVVLRKGAWFVPVVRGWSSASDAEAEAAGVALNRTVEAGGWDSDALASILRDVASTDLGLDGIGFTNDDLADLLQMIDLRDATPDPHDSAAPKLPSAPVTQPGDVWLLGEHRLVCGDCRDPDVVALALDGRKINVAFTSPPYAEQRAYDEGSGFKPIPPDEYVEWFAAVSANVAANLEDDGSWFVNIKPNAEALDTNLYVFDLVTAHVREWGWHFGTEFCWERVGVPKHVTLRFKNQYEPIYQFARGAWKIRPNNVRHLSDAAITPLGPGAGSTTWSGEGKSDLPGQGSGAILPQQRGGYFGETTGQGGAPIGSDAERRRADQLASIAKPRAQGAGKVGASAKDRGRATQLGSMDAAIAKATGASSGAASAAQGTQGALGKRRRSRKGGNRSGVPVQGEENSTSAGVGATIGPGFAYPGNRLPTFSGSHEALGHSAAFPIGLPAFFALAFSDVGDVVFDPFIGSGSSIIAAVRTQRVGVGIELSPGYCDVTAERFQRETGVAPILARTGEPVDLIARRASFDETPTEPASIDEDDAKGQ